MGISPNTALEPSTSSPSGAGVTGTAGVGCVGGEPVVVGAEVVGAEVCDEVDADVVTRIVVGEEWIWPTIRKVTVVKSSIGCCMLLIGVKELAN